MATQVQKHMIQIAAKKGNNVLMARLALMANIEMDYRGNKLQGVFLANAYGCVSAYMTPVEWRQALSVLARQGVYQASQDPEYKGHFGYLVKQASE